MLTGHDLGEDAADVVRRSAPYLDISPAGSDGEWWIGVLAALLLCACTDGRVRRWSAGGDGS